MSTIYFPSWAKCLLFALSNQRSVSFGVPFPVALFTILATSPLHHLTLYSKLPLSLAECCSSARPIARPCSVAVTWQFGRSLSATPASPPQGSDAIAELAATAADGDLGS